MKSSYNIKLVWTDSKNFDINPRPSKTNVNTVSSYSMNDMKLVEIYEGNGFYEIDGTFVPGQFFGGDYDTNKFRDIKEAKKYVENHIDKWLSGEKV